MSGEVLARSLADLLPTNRSPRKEAGQAPQVLADRLRETGIFSPSVPRALDGRETAPIDPMAAIETVAAADGPAGGCAMPGAGNNVASGHRSEEGAREVWVDPARPTAGIAAPAGQAVHGDGGVRVNARWPFASGITHCDWVWPGCLFMEDGPPHMTEQGPDIIHVVMPVDEVTIRDT